MRRQFIAVLLSIALIAVTTPVRLSAQTNCLACKPTKTQNFSLSGTYRVQVWGYTDPAYSISSSQYDAIKAGVEGYWNAFFDANNINITFEFEYCVLGSEEGCPPDPDMVIFADDSETMVNPGALAESTGTSDGHGAYIRIDKTYLTSSYSYIHWDSVGAHEVGHWLGFPNSDTTTNCPAGSSIMQPQGSASIPSTMYCADNLAMTALFVHDPGADPSTEELEYTGDGCWDVYARVIWYCTDGVNEWECGSTSWAYMGNTCSGCCYFLY
jgi:hypothetical protein